MTLYSSSGEQRHWHVRQLAPIGHRANLILSFSPIKTHAEGSCHINRVTQSLQLRGVIVKGAHSLSDPDLGAVFCREVSNFLERGISGVGSATEDGLDGGDVVTGGCEAVQIEGIAEIPDFDEGDLSTDKLDGE